MAVGATVFRFIAITDPAKKKVDKLKTSLSGLGNVAGQLASVGLKTLAASFAAVGAEAGLALRQFAKFDTSMAELQAVLGVSGQELDGLENVIDRVAISTKFSSREIARAAAEVSRLGATKEDVAALLPAIGDFATAINRDATPAGKLLVKVMRAWGEPLDDMAKAREYADLLARAVQKTALDFENLTTALGIVGATGAAADQSLGTVLKTLGFLVSMAVPASRAGTTTRRVLNELSVAGVAGARGARSTAFGLRRLGIDAKEVNLKGRDLIKVFKILGKSTMETAGFVGMFGKRYGLTVKALVRGFEPTSKTREEFEAMSKDIDDLNLTSEKFASIFRNRFGPATRIVWGAFGTLNKQIGKFLVKAFDLNHLMARLYPAIGKLAAALGELMATFTGGEEGTKMFANLWDQVADKIEEFAKYITENKFQIKQDIQEYIKSFAGLTIGVKDFTVKIGEMVAELKPALRLLKELQGVREEEGKKAAEKKRLRELRIAATERIVPPEVFGELSPSAQRMQNVLRAKKDLPPIIEVSQDNIVVYGGADKLDRVKKDKKSGGRSGGLEPAIPELEFFR